MALFVDLDVGDSVKIGDATVTIKHKNGKRTRLSIDAAREVPVSLIKLKNNSCNNKVSTN